MGESSRAGCPAAKRFPESTWERRLSTAQFRKLRSEHRGLPRVPRSKPLPLDTFRSAVHALTKTRISHHMRGRSLLEVFVSWRLLYAPAVWSRGFYIYCTVFSLLAVTAVTINSTRFVVERDCWWGTRPLLPCVGRSRLSFWDLWSRARISLYIPVIEEGVSIRF